MEEAVFVKCEPIHSSEDEESISAGLKKGSCDDWKESLNGIVVGHHVNTEHLNVKVEPVITVDAKRDDSPVGKKTEYEEKSSDSECKDINNEDGDIDHVVEPIVMVDTDIPSPKGDVGTEDFRREYNRCTGESKSLYSSAAPKETSESDDNDEKKYECNLCLKRFLHRGSLNKHLIMHNGKKQSGERFQCNICLKYFGEPGSLRSHAVVHSGKREFQCSLCEKRFLRRSNLRQHLVAHSARQFECPVCHKFFRYAWNLRAHERVHTRDRNFQCALCSKSYGSKSILKEHLLTHTNERTFKCKICSKAFLRKYYLVVHMLTHTKEKRYECHVCAKRFARCNDLRNHTAKHYTIVVVQE